VGALVKGLTGVSCFSGLAALAPLRFFIVLEAVIGTSFALNDSGPISSVDGRLVKERP